MVCTVQSGVEEEWSDIAQGNRKAFLDSISEDNGRKIKVGEAAISEAQRSFEREMGVHQFISWFMICGTDLFIDTLPMSPGDTITAFCQGKMIGARRLEECPDLDKCSFNILRSMPIYQNDPWDTAVDCPSLGDIIDFEYNGLPVLSVPVVNAELFGETVPIAGFEYDPNCCILRGDLDNSGEIDISDLLFLIDYMFTQGPVPICYLSADLTNDSAVDISDLLHMIDYMFNQGPAPVECN